MYNYKAFAERVAQLNIKYSRTERICKMLDSIRANRNMGNGINSARHSFIIGTSGVGKTQMVKRYAEKNPGYTHIDDENTEFDIRPVVYVEMLILDEIDYILSSRHVKPLEAMDTIKHIGNQTNISLVCVGTTEAGKLRILNDQYFRRLAPIYLDRFSSPDDEFCSFLENIEDTLNPPTPIGLGDLNTGLPQLLHGMSRGIVGYLTPTIQEAFRLVGVFEYDFEHSAKFAISVDILLEAYKNIIGDLTQDDLDRIICG